jgi:hypothetical protein
MGQTTFSGPIKAGTIQNTTGTTVGELRNVGSVNVMQTGIVKQTATTFTSDIVIPANSLITRMYVFRTTIWNGAAATFGIGDQNAGDTFSPINQAGGTVGLLEIAPGTSVPRNKSWLNVGTSDIRLVVTNTNTGTGIGTLVVEYLQNEGADNSNT